jgi:flagellar protein FliO/FliZ
MSRASCCSPTRPGMLGSILLVGAMLIPGRLAVGAGQPSPRVPHPELSLGLQSNDNDKDTPSSQPTSIRVPRQSGLRPGHLLDPNARVGPQSQGSNGWWLGSAGIALILAVCGAICVAARKYLPQDSSALVHVLGRVNLSPKHSVFLVRAGQHLLLIGTGPQGAPSLLGELIDPEETEQLAAKDRDGSSRMAFRDSRPVAPSNPRPSPRVDVRLGDEE